MGAYGWNQGVFAMHMFTSSEISMVMFDYIALYPSQSNGCCRDDQMLKHSPMTVASTPLNHYKKIEVNDGHD
jgi:hypothetical protein